MTAKLVVTLAPGVVGVDAVAFAARAKARGADLLELRTDLHRPDAIDVDALAAHLDVLAAARRAPLPLRWRRRAALVDGALGTADARECSLVSLHAERPLAPIEAAARWSAAAPGPPVAHVKHVEPLVDPASRAEPLRDALPRLMETRALLERRFGAGRVTVLVTGPLALPFRAVLAEGNALDYVALSPAWLAAPGQRTLDDAVAARRALTTTARLGIVGVDLAGSRSPRVHRAPFDRVELPDDAPLEELLDALHPHYRGFAVTSPFKKRAARLVPAPDGGLDAINTLVRATQGYAGATTDVAGARAALELLVRGPARDRQVTVLGDGGATAALRVAARSLAIELVVVTRAAVRAPLTGAVLWTWPARVAPPAALAFHQATVGVIAYGAPARVIAAAIRARGGVPRALGPRWFAAQARAQRALWDQEPPP